MSETKRNIKYLSQETEKFYQAINPNIQVQDSQNYVWFNSAIYEADNAYPNKLIDLYQNASSVHSNFINLKTNLLYSTGLLPLNSEDVNLKNYLETPVNRAGHTLNDIFKKLCADMALFEAAAYQLIYNREGKVAEIYHVSPANLRASNPNEFGFSDTWYYSTSWGIVDNKRRRKSQNQFSKSIEIKNYNPDTGIQDKRQILYVKKYSPSAIDDVYAIPSYNSILNWVQLDFELSQFHLNKVVNNLSPSGIVVMKGNPDDDEKDAFVKNFKRNHTGSDNAGKLLFIWTDGADQTPEFIRFEGDKNDGIFEELSINVNEHIAVGHGAPLALIGMDKSNSIGNDSMKLNTARSYFLNTVIEPMQEVLISSINKILKINGYSQVKIENKPLVFETSSTVDTNNSNLNNETEVKLNDKLSSLSGKEWIQLMRIIRNIKNKKLNKDAGVMMLKQSYGIDDETIDNLLADESADDEIVTNNNEDNKQIL
jgi:hypothetical protein